MCVSAACVQPHTYIGSALAAPIRAPRPPHTPHPHPHQHPGYAHSLAWSFLQIQLAAARSHVHLATAAVAVALFEKLDVDCEVGLCVWKAAESATLVRPHRSLPLGLRWLSSLCRVRSVARSRERQPQEVWAVFQQAAGFLSFDVPGCNRMYPRQRPYISRLQPYLKGTFSRLLDLVAELVELLTDPLGIHVLLKGAQGCIRRGAGCGVRGAGCRARGGAWI